MSFGELLVVVIIALFVIKPDDIPIILDKINKFKTLFTNLKHQALSYVNQEVSANDQDLNGNIEEMNFYLQKILLLQGHYEGDYSIEQVKSKYQELVKKELDKQKNSKA